MKQSKKTWTVIRGIFVMERAGTPFQVFLRRTQDRTAFQNLNFLASV
jgi:hypothetical protein